MSLGAKVIAAGSGSSPFDDKHQIANTLAGFRMTANCVTTNKNKRTAAIYF
jgi:hypothetical protein